MQKKDITYQEKYNELRLDISHPNNRKQTFVLVEGDSDIRLFRKFFNLDNCNVECIPGGKFKLEECVGELSQKHALIMGIRDADFCHLAEEKYSKKNMFLTDYHDIEITMLAQEDILSAFLFEYLPDLKKAEHAILLQHLMNTISIIGYLKWLSEEEKMEFSFEVGFDDLMKFEKQTIDVEKYIQRVVGKSANAKIKDFSTIVEKIEKLSAKQINLFHLTNGHDLLKTFARYFREKAARKGLSAEILESTLRISFNLENYKKTELFKQTASWAESQNVKMYE